MGKSNAYFERMYRSSEIMENLTTVLTIFTVLIFAVGLYPVLKDYQLESGNTQSSYVVFLIALLISIFAMLFFTFLIPMIRKNKIVFLIVSILAILFLMFSIH